MCRLLRIKNKHVLYLDSAWHAVSVMLSCSISAYCNHLVFFSEAWFLLDKNISRRHTASPGWLDRHTAPLQMAWCSHWSGHLSLRTARSSHELRPEWSDHESGLWSQTGEGLNVGSDPCKWGDLGHRCRAMASAPVEDRWVGIIRGQVWKALCTVLVGPWYVFKKRQLVLNHCD